MKLETDRLLIRPTSIADADFVLELIHSDLYIQNIGKREIHTREDAIAHIEEKMIMHYKENGFGNHTIILKESGVKIGSVSLFNRSELGVVDIGFAFLPDYIRQNYGYEASVKLKDYAENVLGLEKLCGITLESNLASRKLLQKLGLTYKKNILFGEKKEVLEYYEITF